jgi:hypothetical protein
MIQEHQTSLFHLTTSQISLAAQKWVLLPSTLLSIELYCIVPTGWTRDELCVYIMLGLSTASELSWDIPLVPHSFVVTQLTLQASNSDLPISFTLGPHLTFPLTDSQDLFHPLTYFNRKIVALHFSFISG